MATLNMSKGQQIEMLLEIGVRLQKRYVQALSAYVLNPNSATKHRMEVLERTKRRWTRRMQAVISS